MHTADIQFDHVVQFYHSDRFLVNAACSFLSIGIREDSPALVVCTPAHWADIERGLESAGIAVTTLQRHGSLVWVDASQLLVDYLHPGGVDWAAYEATLRALLRDLTLISEDRPLQIYGELAHLLASAGRRGDALHEEAICNDLSSDFRFRLMCSYRVGTDTSAEYLQDICDEHSHVLRSEKPIGIALVENIPPGGVRLGERHMAKALHMRDQRILEGLREDLASTHFSLLLNANKLLAHVPSDLVDQWSNLVKGLDRSLHQSLLLAEEISPMRWQVSALVAGLTEYATLISTNSDAVCEVEVDADFSEPPRVERVLLYGILCEALDRVAGRLRATLVTVSLSGSATGAQISLSHNGDNLVLTGHDDDRLRRLIYQAGMFSIEVQLRRKGSNSLQLLLQWRASIGVRS